MSQSNHTSDQKPSVRAAFAGGGSGGATISTYNDRHNVEKISQDRSGPTPK